MNTDKSAQECSSCLYNNPHKQPDYLSGKIIEGLNGKLFNTDSLTGHLFQSSSKEIDFNRKQILMWNSRLGTTISTKQKELYEHRRF